MMLTFVFVGVGGQGVLSAARFLGDAVFRKGIEVNVSQLHGMSQRGGTVHASVVVNGAVGCAPDAIDVLVALDLIEACRVAGRLCERTVALCNTHALPLPAAALRRLRIPDFAALSSKVDHRAGVAYFVNATDLARHAGNLGMLNVVMLGALSQLAECPVTDAELLASVLELGSAGSRERNQRAFALGRDAMRGALE